jgi:hypothetical protein
LILLCSSLWGGCVGWERFHRKTRIEVEAKKERGWY